MLNGILTSVVIIEFFVLIYAIFFYKGGIKMGFLNLRKKKKELPIPPKAETTEVIKPTTQHEETPKEDQLTQEEFIQQQKEADLDYYSKLYDDTYNAGDFKKGGKDMAELANLLYGILAEVKTLNFQVAQLLKK